MTEKIKRRSFFGAVTAVLAAPLALLGGKKEDSTDIRVKRWYDTARYYAEDADHWRERALAAEFDLECLGVMPSDEEALRQSRLDYEQGNSRTAKEIYDELREETA